MRGRVAGVRNPAGATLLELKLPVDPAKSFDEADSGVRIVSGGESLCLPSTNISSPLVSLLPDLLRAFFTGGGKQQGVRKQAVE